jgi:glycosyltransferase involved in cell wall biosynthesis
MSANPMCSQDFKSPSPSLASLSIVIPARNEEQFLPKCLEAIKAASHGVQVPIEVVVVLNRCTDRTAEIAKEFGCTVVEAGGKNLSHIRNSGVRAARGEMIITIDADSVMSPNMLTAVLEELSSGKNVGGGVLIKPERYSLGILMSGLMLLPVALYHRISAGLFFFRKDDFNAIGGFDEKLFSAEDIDFAKRLRAHGKATGRKYRHLLKAHITTSCRKFDRFGDWHFVLRPWLFWRLLKGKDQAAANQVWYDFNDRS